MPNDDTMLGQNTVDIRNEERRAFLCGDPEQDWIDEQRDAAREEQTAFCICSDGCQADADEHEPGCPIEAELRETFGF